MRMALRRPLLHAFTMGCCISLAASGRITPRLLLPAALYWLFVPTCEIASLAVVARRCPIPFSRAVDLFLKSDQWWLVWLILFSALWAFIPTRTVYSWPGLKPVQYGSAIVVAAVTAVHDYRFFRSALKKTPAAAIRGLGIQRLLFWMGAATIFAAGSAVQVVGAGLGL